MLFGKFSKCFVIFDRNFVCPSFRALSKFKGTFCIMHHEMREAAYVSCCNGGIVEHVMPATWKTIHSHVDGAEEIIIRKM